MDLAGYERLKKRTDKLKAMVEKKEEDRWGILVTLPPCRSFGEEYVFLAGRFCFLGGSRDDPVTRTFRTRKQARKAKKEMTSYGRDSRIVKLRVTYEVIR